MPSATLGFRDERVVFMEWKEPIAQAIDGDPVAVLTALCRSASFPERAVHTHAPDSNRLLAQSALLPPVLLIHGSPGRASLFSDLGPLIAGAGYRVIAMDLPGFGDSSRDIDDHSMLAHSRRVLALMDQLDIARAHVVGWSNGGGVALHLAAAAKDRLASLTLLSAVGDQAVEGSGSYTVEHVKYAVGFAGFAIPDLLPHFGHFDTHTRRTAFLRNFWDSDQRPLRAVLEHLTTPTLIMHGRQDCMLPVKAALHHHELVENSSLVLMRANHFLPLTHPAQTAAALVPFFGRHNTPDVPEPRTTTNLDPDPDHHGLMRLLHTWSHEISRAPWWAQAGALSVFVLLFPSAGVLAGAWLVTVLQVDYMVAFVGILVGLLYQTLLLLLMARVLGQRIYRIPWLGNRLARVSAADWTRRMSTRPAREGWATTFLPRQRAPSALGAVLYAPSTAATGRFLLSRLPALVAWSFVTYGIALFCFVWVYRQLHHVTLLPFTIACVVIAVIIRTIPMLVVRRGRQRLRAKFERIVNYEYWPMSVFYAPLVPYVCWLMLKHRSITLLTCCNPGIENGGGLIGESKHAIMKQLGDHESVLPTLLIAPDADPRNRVQQVIAAMQRAELAFPVILKPDAGQRGFGVSLVRDLDQARAYFEHMTSPAVLQLYAAGPCECGILWARHPRPTSDNSLGFIFSITRKDFPIIIGDGRHTVEELILRHPRYRRQADVFLGRHADRAMDDLRENEPFALGVAGNHCQGALFRDGADLITPELSRVIDNLARSFQGGLDFGRFDLRYESDELLRAGRCFSIVELNGTTSESTNLYDPSKSVFWAYSVLFAQWRLLFELGAQRRAQGARPMGLSTVIATVTEHYRTRRGNPVSS